MIKQSIILATAVVIGTTGLAQARDQIRIVGSSTVFPFATAVAEQFGKTTQFKTPVIESTGSGGGLKLFCAGVGVKHPDITNASRRIKMSEVKRCARNGVKEIVEVKLGFDGIVLANSKKSPQAKLTQRIIFLALAKKIMIERVAKERERVLGREPLALGGVEAAGEAAEGQNYGSRCGSTSARSTFGARQGAST